MEYTSPDEVAFVIWLHFHYLCLLKTEFDHDTFIRLQNELKNLNKVIDRNYYP
jgi:hypothetical protein